MSKAIRLLMIDDSSSDVFLIREILLSSIDQHFDIESCSTLASGLQRLAQSTFDLTLLDLSLTDSRGPETFAQIQTAFPDMAVIVMSGVDDLDSVKTVVESGAQDYLVKGEINRNTLKRAILNSILRKNRERNFALFQRAFDGIRTGILICDDQGEIVFCNRGAARMHGCSPAELQGKFLATVSPDLHQCISEECFEKQSTIRHRRVQYLIDPITISAGRKGFAVTVLSLE